MSCLEPVEQIFDLVLNHPYVSKQCARKLEDKMDDPPNTLRFVVGENGSGVSIVVDIANQKVEVHQSGTIAGIEETRARIDVLEKALTIATKIDFIFRPVVH
jgi:predicted ATPase